MEVRALKLFFSVLLVFGFESCLKCWFDICGCIFFSFVVWDFGFK